MKTKLLLEEYLFEDASEETLETEPAPEDAPTDSGEEGAEEFDLSDIDLNAGAETADDNGTEDGGEQVATQEVITYKVSYTLGTRSNWSRIDASSEEEANTKVKEYITQKYPDRKFEIVSTEEYDEVSEGLSAVKTVNENVQGQGKYSDKCYKFLEFLQDLDNYDDIIYLTRQLIRYAQEEDLKDMWFQRFDSIADRLGFEKQEDQDSLDEDLEVQGTAIETDSAIGMATVVADLIKGEYDTINEYNSAIATAEAEGYGELTQVLINIQAEENVHIGQLQALMERFNPNAELIQDGKEEGEQQLGAPSPTEDIEEYFNENLNNAKSKDYARLNKVSNKFHRMNADTFLESYKAGTLTATIVESMDKIPNYKKAIRLSDCKIGCDDGSITTHKVISPYDGIIYSYTEC